MARILDRDGVRRFYDRLGGALDSQAFYENAGLDVLCAHGAFDRAGAVFEFGCGTGRFAQWLLEEFLPADARYLGVDLSPRMVELARRRLAPWADRARVELTDGDVHLPQADSGWDRFVSTFVVDLLPEHEARVLLCEAHRILRGNGRLCLVSITRGTTPLSRAVMGCWSALGRLSPWLTGGCRPVVLRSLLHPEQWDVAFDEVVIRFGVAMEVLVASPHGEG